MSLHIATDLDGTISFAGKRPDATILDALSAFSRREGTAVTIATARSPRVVGEWFGVLGRDLGQVCCNGAIVATERGTVARQGIDPVLVHMLVMWLRDRGEGFCLEYGDRFAASDANALPWMGMDSRITLGETSPMLEDVVKICVATGAIWAETLALLAGDAAEVYPHATGDADIVAGGVNKAAGVRRLHTAGHRLVALGNDRNDLELLLTADAAIVVGDQLPELDACSHVRRVPANPITVVRALQEATELSERIAV
ncbi:hydroxymethylpyrimidine pyrophosphatase-like HAD family hydrolase [Microbacterium sp. W4I4]|uniref:HAD hydrolase family protein n=1 Tax=Microbacterium sp. W4I4 TaxID=3042295 RepID=UPI00278816B0|nr:HAD hydrolase family protein [Microbacterium sp. W4I4]MDQ0615877.1 hydroxymethylpyrimidine pyrophosphatase-like HAD family hydrolase [Microbacterium sp. W4I4]